MENLETKIKELTNELDKFKDVLESKLNKLKESLKSNTNKRRKPKIEERYWYLSGTNETTYYVIWYDYNVDNKRYNNYNCFLTKEEAEKAQRVKETENMLRRYIEEHDTVELDWENSTQRKWNLVYNFEKKEIYYDYDYSFKRPRTIYASNKEILENAVKEIGNDRIVEYLTY